MKRKGFVLAFVSLAVFILAILGMGLLAISNGVKRRAVVSRDNVRAKLAAESGYAEAINWMNRQNNVFSDTLNPVKMAYAPSVDDAPGIHYEYSIAWERFNGTQSVYRIVSTGFGGKAISETVQPWRSIWTIEADVVQVINGWDMGLCERPNGPPGNSTITSNTIEIPFTANDVIEMPVHINSNGDPEDKNIDIHTENYSGDPKFVEKLSMGESRYSDMINRRGQIGSNDKYSKVMDYFESGVYFNQPDNSISDQAYTTSANPSVAARVDRFIKTTDRKFKFSGVGPLGKTPKIDVKYMDGPDINGVDDDVENAATAVQLEFYINNGIGMVRITNNCIVRCYDDGRYDYKVNSDQSSLKYKRYNSYGYHFIDSSSTVNNYRIEDMYTAQKVNKPSVGEFLSEPGGQIYVNGNVIIGGQVSPVTGQIWINSKSYDSRIKGKITVVATGNIWIISPLIYEGEQISEYDDSGYLTKLVPASTNENVLGLFSQNGVVKVVDPGQGVESMGTAQADSKRIQDYYENGEDDDPPGLGLTPRRAGFELGFGLGPYFRLVCRPGDDAKPDPQPMIVQAAITCGGGGFGVENVDDRFALHPSGIDTLIVAGSITEVLQGLVEKNGKGFKRHYYFDKRLSNGILPGDMWLQRKYVPLSGAKGWKDRRANLNK